MPNSTPSSTRIPGNDKNDDNNNNNNNNVSTTKTPTTTMTALTKMKPTTNNNDNDNDNNDVDDNEDENNDDDDDSNDHNDDDDVYSCAVPRGSTHRLPPPLCPPLPLTYASDVRGCVMYVTLFPCNECAKLAIQAGISKIIYLSDKHHAKPEMIASRKLFDMVSE